MLKAKYHIILCFFLFFLPKGKLYAQNDSIKKSFGFLKASIGMGITNIYVGPNGLYNGLNLSLMSALPIKHTPLSIGFSIAYSQFKFNEVWLSSVSTPDGDHATSLNAHLGAFLQLPFFETKGTFYVGLLGGIMSLQIPEYLYSSGEGGVVFSYTTHDELKASSTAFSANLKFGLIFPIFKKLLLGFNFDVIYSNLNNGLVLYTQNYKPLPYPPQSWTTSYKQQSELISVASFTIGFKID